MEKYLLSGWISVHLGQRLRAPSWDGAGATERSYPMPKVRGGGREEQPHVQGAVAVWAQEGEEELLLIQGQEGRLWGDIPHPR